LQRKKPTQHALATHFEGQMKMNSLVQLQNVSGMRRVALVNGNTLRLIASDFPTAYDLAFAAVRSGSKLVGFAEAHAKSDTLNYNPIYVGQDPEWRLLPAFDHPAETARCMVSGTGLTHRASAENRQAMHAATAPVSDSMRMYEWGVAGGRPATGTCGAQPEWFYKGTGSVLRAHGEPLVVPPYADDGGEEAEIAGIYLVDTDGIPHRVGMALSNEFSDHVMEEKNYLYLAPSKLRNCAIGPELIIGPEFDDVVVKVQIQREREVVWSVEFRSGEKHMCHSVANLEHHHFKYEAHRRPGDAHVYFFGTDAFSFAAGVRLMDGDIMEISAGGFGRPLRNPVQISKDGKRFVSVKVL
jgi:hypothetical protein